MAAYTKAIVSWLNIPASYTPKIPNAKTASSLIPLSQMHHNKLWGLTKAFMATLSCLQTNNPLSAKICHLDCAAIWSYSAA